MKKERTYKDYLSKQELLMAKKQENEKGLEQKMQKGVCDEYLKYKRNKEAERKTLYRAKKAQEKQGITEPQSPSNTAYLTPHAHDKSKILNEHGETKLCIKDIR